MALISAKTILTSLCLFHVTLGFFFLTSPITVADQALVFILGESMGMVRRLAPPAPPPSPRSGKPYRKGVPAAGLARC